MSYYKKAGFLLVLMSFSIFAADRAAQHKKFLHKTFQLATHARHKGNHPFGALLVYKGLIILTAENLVTTSHDVTAHAEMELLRKASQLFSKEVLSQSTLYSSTEPCTMCTGAIYWSGVSHVVYGCSTQSLEYIAHGGLAISSTTIVQQGKRTVLVEGPFFEPEAIKVHEGFW